MKLGKQLSARSIRGFLRQSLLISLCVWSSVGAAGQPADLSGTWSLNLGASFFGGDHPFPDYTLTKVLHMNGQIMVQTESSSNGNIVNLPLPNGTVSRDFTLDGKEHVIPTPDMFPGQRGPDRRVLCEWQGDTLVVTEHNLPVDDAYYSENRLFLSADGSQLIEIIVKKFRFGDQSQRLVFGRL
jgi:hypothetical protein